MTSAPRKRRGNPPESPWANGGAEASRNTVRRMIRLRPEEDTALARVAARRGLDLARAIGALAIEDERRQAAEQEIDDAGVDTGRPVT